MHWEIDINWPSHAAEYSLNSGDTLSEPQVSMDISPLSVTFSADLFFKFNNFNPVALTCNKLSMHWSRAVWEHAKLNVQVHSRSRSTGTKPSSLSLPLSCETCKSTLHLSVSHFCNIFFFHNSAASMSSLEKLLQEIGRLTNFSPDQVSTMSVTFFWFHFISHNLCV